MNCRCRASGSIACHPDEYSNSILKIELYVISNQLKFSNAFHCFHTINDGRLISRESNVIHSSRSCIIHAQAPAPYRDFWSL
jgi:hypothetical protein